MTGGTDVRATSRRTALRVTLIVAAVLLVVGGATAALAYFTPAGNRLVASLTASRVADGTTEVTLGNAGSTVSFVPAAGWRVAGPIRDRLWLTSPDERVTIAVDATLRGSPREHIAKATESDDATPHEETLASGLHVTHATGAGRIVAIVDAATPIGVTVEVGADSDADAVRAPETRRLAAEFLEGVGSAPPVVADDALWAEPLTLESGTGDEAAALDVTHAEPFHIRNPDVGVRARFVYLPGDGGQSFNDRTDEIVRTAITAAESESGETYRPHAGEGLAERGCRPGSLAETGEAILQESGSTDAPASVAVACEVRVAAGPIAGVTYRTVQGSGSDVASDTRETLLVDTRSGTLTDPAGLWDDDAAAALWATLAEQVRREAGALSLAAVPEPGDEELAAFRAARNDGTLRDDGAVTVPLSAEFLATLPGAASPAAPLTLVVAPGTEVTGPLSETGAAFADAVSQAEGYAGPERAPAGHERVDCTLVPCVSLTYDDGPTDITPELLDTYRSHHAAATFFMMGDAASGAHDVVARVVAEGHEIGNHTWSHPDLAEASESTIVRELTRTTDALEAASGTPVTMFRPPYGAYDDEVLSVAGMPAILWTIDTNDWQVPGEAALVERAGDGATPGSIILFHDTHADSVNVAGTLLDRLADRGFTPVTVSQLWGSTSPAGGSLPASGVVSAGPPNTHADTS